MVPAVAGLSDALALGCRHSYCFASPAFAQGQMGSAECCGKPLPATAATINSPTIREAKESREGRGAAIKDGALRRNTTVTKGRSSAKNKDKEKVDTEQNILVMALLADFKESLRDRFKSCQDAFERLGGSDDNRIDLGELNQFLVQQGYNNGKLNDQLFKYLDEDGDGFISKGEFMSLFMGHTAELSDFKERLREMFKTITGAFNRLGGADDGLIEPAEFEEFCIKSLGYSDTQLIQRLFGAIDDNKDGTITKSEFKALFQPQGEFAIVTEFKDAVKKKFKSCMEAFDQLGGGDDGQIDREEFQRFMDSLLGYANTELNDQLFNVIDDNGDGAISKGEFKALFVHHTVKIMEFKEILKERYKTRKNAFEKLGGEDDAQIDLKEFQIACCRDLGMNDKEEAERLFRMIDNNGDNIITKEEFKTFFLVKQH